MCVRFCRVVLHRLELGVSYVDPLAATHALCSLASRGYFRCAELHRVDGLLFCVAHAQRLTKDLGFHCTLYPLRYCIPIASIVDEVAAQGSHGDEKRDAGEH